MGGRLLLPTILLVGAALRLFLLLGPFSEIDADEAVVGLMALQVPGELPAFFWEQHYLGSAEAFVAAGLFTLLGPSAASLKLVPALFSLAFIWLTYLTARRAFGVGPAVLTVAYLAVPPSFLAAWSVKARGGYAELLAFGALFLLACQHLADMGLGARGWAALAGLSGGLALWTHPLGAVYLAAGSAYVVLARRAAVPTQAAACRAAAPGARAGDSIAPAARTWPWKEHLSARVGAGVAALTFLAGLGPALAYNLAHGFPSLRFAADGGTEPGAVVLNLWGFVRYGLPVLVGLAEGTPTKALLDQDWPHRPGSSWLATVTLPLLGLAVIWWVHGSLVDLMHRGGDRSIRPADARPGRGAALFVFVLAATVAAAAVTRFANLWAEPRYALPIYSAVPLFAAAAWSIRARSRALFLALVLGVIALNVVSLLTSNYRLSLPVSAGASTAENRAELIGYLLDRGIDRIYTDYWLAYPIAFESRERIVPGIRSGGFSRRPSYSHLAWTADDPAFVFAVGTPGDDEFRRDLNGVGGTANLAEVAVYRIYSNVTPLEGLRRP